MCVPNEKHQNRPLNLPPRPQNNVQSARNENNIDQWGDGGGLFYVITMSKENDDIRKSVVNVVSSEYLAMNECLFCD